MRVWDINPGYLNRQNLLGEHRELHGIVSILVNRKKGYANHPETVMLAKWEQGFGGPPEMEPSETWVEQDGEINPISTVVTVVLKCGSSEGGFVEAGFDNVLNSPVDMTHSDVWSETGVNYVRLGDPTGTRGNISVDPQFSNAARHNYRLRFGSPCIDSGDGLTAPSEDFMGAPRYDDPRTVNTGVADAGGAIPDLGAYEFVEGAQSDLDLVVTEVSGPARAVAGGQRDTGRGPGPLLPRRAAAAAAGGLRSGGARVLVT